MCGHFHVALLYSSCGSLSSKFHSCIPPPAGNVLDCSQLGASFWCALWTFLCMSEVNLASHFLWVTIWEWRGQGLVMHKPCYFSESSVLSKLILSWCVGAWLSSQAARSEIWGQPGLHYATLPEQTTGLGVWFSPRVLLSHAQALGFSPDTMTINHSKNLITTTNSSKCDLIWK